MERVLGIGGYFLRAADPEALSAWYRDSLGLDADEHGLWLPGAGPTVFAAFEADTDYFGARDQQTMLNFRVRDLDAMLAQLRADGRGGGRRDAGHGRRRPVRLGHRSRGQPDRALAARLAPATQCAAPQRVATALRPSDGVTRCARVGASGAHSTGSSPWCPTSFRHGRCSFPRQRGPRHRPVVVARRSRHTAPRCCGRRGRVRLLGRCPGTGSAASSRSTRRSATTAGVAPPDAVRRCPPGSDAIVLEHSLVVPLGFLLPLVAGRRLGAPCRALRFPGRPGHRDGSARRGSDGEPRSGGRPVDVLFADTVGTLTATRPSRWW